MVYINNYNVISSLGVGKENHKGVFLNECGLRKDTLLNDKNTFTGTVDSSLQPVPEEYKNFNSRNNQLLLTVLKPIQNEFQEAIKKYGRDRVGVIIGTSTSGISDVENAFGFKKNNNHFPDEYDYRQHEMGSAPELIRKMFNINGPGMTISTACSSGAKAIISAYRMIEAGLCDVVLTGGVDTICHLTLCGFSSLEVISENQCMPFSKDRSGINIGEAGALFIISKEKSHLAIKGFGESSDAHHHSAPHPEGNGAYSSMEKAMKMAQLGPTELDYLNLHGTGTAQNDSMEAKAVDRLKLTNVPCSSNHPS